MAKYTLDDSAIMRRNGPDNDVRSVKEPTAVYKRGPGRKWIGNGREYQNFAALLSERSFGVEDVPSDPYGEAVTYFSGAYLSRGLLYTDRAKGHAIEIIKRVVAENREPVIWAWDGGTESIH